MLGPTIDVDDPTADLDEDSDDSQLLVGVVDWQPSSPGRAAAKIVSTHLDPGSHLVGEASPVRGRRASPVAGMLLTGFGEQVRAEGLPESSGSSTIGVVAAAVAAAARSPLQEEQPSPGARWQSSRASTSAVTSVQADGGSLLLAAQANAAQAQARQLAATELVYRSAIAEAEADAEAQARKQRLAAAAATTEAAAATALARRDADAARAEATAARAEAAAARSAERTARSECRVDTLEAAQQTEAVAASPPHTPLASRHRPAAHAADGSRPPRPTPERPPSLTGCGNHDDAPAATRARPRRLPLASCDDAALEAARAELHLRRKQMQRLKRLEEPCTCEQLVSAWGGRGSRSLAL